MFGSLDSDWGEHLSPFAPPKGAGVVWILGRAHQLESAWREDLAGLIWCSYRRNFPELSPYPITSDSGWGCMLRAAQMLMAHALRMHTLGRRWQPGSVTYNKRCSEYCAILRAVADAPGDAYAYSLHNMVKLGYLHDKLPGEWFGPGAASHVLKALAAMQRVLHKSSLAVVVSQGDTLYLDQVRNAVVVVAHGPSEENDSSPNGNSVAAAAAAPAEAENLLARQNDAEASSSGAKNDNNNNNSGHAREQGSGHSGGAPPSSGTGTAASRNDSSEKSRTQSFEVHCEGTPLPLSSPPSSAPLPLSAEPVEVIDPLLNPPPVPKKHDEEGGSPKKGNRRRSRHHHSHRGEEGARLDRRGGGGAGESINDEAWACAAVLLIPVRLGLHQLQPEYAEALAKILELPQSLGFLGGSPNHAIWFVGHRNGYSHHHQNSSSFSSSSSSSSLFSPPPPSSSSSSAARSKHQPDSNSSSTVKSASDANSSSEEEFVQGSIDSSNNSTNSSSDSSSSDSSGAFSLASLSFLGLDPHTVQPAATKLRRKRPEDYDPEAAAAWPVDDEAWLQSMHTQSFAKVTATRLDPSLALGFYCRHAIDFDALQRSLKQIAAEVATCGGAMPFTIEEESPRDDIASENESHVSGTESTNASSNEEDDDDGFSGSGRNGSGGGGGHAGGGRSSSNGGAFRSNAKKGKSRHARYNSRGTSGKSTEWHEKSTLDDPEDDFVLV